MDLISSKEDMEKEKFDKDDPNAYAMYLVVRESLNMSPGKMAAQVGHAVMALAHAYTELVIREMYLGTKAAKMAAYVNWMNNCRKVVLRANDIQWEALKKLALIGWDQELVIDSGYTEIEPNSETVIGFWPMKKSDAPQLIKELRCY